MTMQANDQVSDQVDNPSGVANPNDQDSSQVVDDNAHEKVSYHTHKKLLAQRKADQLKYQEAQKRIEEYERKEAEAAEQKLIETNQFKELADQRAQEIAELRAERESHRKAMQDGAKLNAFKELLPGQIKNKSYYAFVNLDAIEVDPDTGAVDAASVERQVNEFVTQHSGLYTPKQGATLPGEAPQGNTPATFEAELRKCKTQKEYDECLKKWGRA